MKGERREPFVCLFQAVAKPLLFVMLGLSTVVGITAVINPRAFDALVAVGNRWVDTWSFFHVSQNSRLRLMDKWVDVDHFALPRTRGIGIAIVVACLVLSATLYAVG